MLSDHSSPWGLITYSTFLAVLHVLILISTSLFITLKTVSHLYLDHRWKMERKEYRVLLITRGRVSEASAWSTGDVLMPSAKGFRIAYIEYSRAFDAFWQGLPIRFGQATRSSVAVVVVQVLIECETGAWSFHHTTTPSKSFYVLEPRCKRNGWLHHQCNALLLGSFLTCSIMKTRFYHSGRISVVRARTYVGWSFSYDVTHPATKDPPPSSQVLHAYRVLITCWSGE